MLLFRNVPQHERRKGRQSGCRNYRRGNWFGAAAREFGPGLASALQSRACDRWSPSSLVPRRQLPHWPQAHASHRRHFVDVARCRFTLVPAGRHVRICAAKRTTNDLGPHGEWLGTAGCVARKSGERPPIAPSGGCCRPGIGVDTGPRRVSPRGRKTTVIGCVSMIRHTLRLYEPVGKSPCTLARHRA